MKIGVVIVTYNRIEKLKKALTAFELQTKSPSYIIVVNNASTDKTSSFLKKWKTSKSGYKKYVVNLSENIGGSGGFYRGLKFALKLDSNWIWLSDDDAFPEKKALEVADKYLNNNLSAVCGTVINNGKIDLGHRKKYKLGKFKLTSVNYPQELYKREKFNIECFSYVGTILNKKKLEKVGLTREDYFIWLDDTEHSLRLSKVGDIICVPSIRVHHDVGNYEDTYSWKDYYGIRNAVDMYRELFPSRYYKYFCCESLIKSSTNILIGRNTEYNRLSYKASCCW